MNKEEKNLAVVENQALATTAMIDFEGDAGAGMEGADGDSYAIPFIAMLQPLSPKVDTVDGAKAGLFINSITDDLYEEVLVIPCAFQRRYIRWAPRSSGEGYKGDYAPTDIETGRVAGCREIEGRYLFDVPEVATSVLDKDGKPMYDNARDTRNHYVLYLDKDGVWKPALISMAGTLVKKSKRWMARIQGIEIKNAKGKGFNPPSFSHIYKLVRPPKKDEKNGGSWWSIDVNLVEQVTDANLYQKAKEFHDLVASGAVKATPVQDEVADAVSNSDSDKF